MTTALPSRLQFAVPVSTGRRRSSGKELTGMFFGRLTKPTPFDTFSKNFLLLWIQTSFFVIKKQCILHDLKRRKPSGERS